MIQTAVFRLRSAHAERVSLAIQDLLGYLSKDAVAPANVTRGEVWTTLTVMLKHGSARKTSDLRDMALVCRRAVLAADPETDMDIRWELY